MKPRPLPSIERLNELFIYNPETGVITNRINRGGTAKAGLEAGCLDRLGYRTIKISGKQYFAHRIAYKIITGSDPGHLEIDHANGNRSDNRPHNLRAASHSENNTNKTAQRNSTTGIKGVSWCKREKKYRASICKEGRQRSLGYYRTPEEAARAYSDAAKKLHGEFAGMAGIEAAQTQEAGDRRRGAGSMFQEYLP